MRALRIALGTALITILLAGLGLVAAQVPDCAGKQCIELPLVQGAGTAAPTPTIGPILPSGTECDVNAPAPVEGAQAWMTNTHPAPRTYTYLCVRLIVRSRLVTGAPVSAVLHRAMYDETYTVTDYSGGQYTVARIAIFSGDEHPGTVAVDAAAFYLGAAYPARTSFISAPQVTDTPAPTGTPTRTPTHVPTSTPTLTPTP